MNEELRFNDEECQKSRWRISARSLGAIGMIDAGEGRKKSVASVNASCAAIEQGVYVPDEVNIDTCLSCTRTRCTGNCKKIKKSRRDGKK